MENNVKQPSACLDALLLQRLSFQPCEAQSGLATRTSELWSEKSCKETMSCSICSAETYRTYVLSFQRI